jgi:hypothetical protein
MDEGQLQERLLTNDPLHRRNNMSQGNYLGLSFAANLKAHPDWFDQSAEAVNAAANKGTAFAHAVRKLNETAKPIELHKEYNRLRQDLFNFQEWAKHSEIYCNDKAGEVKLLETRVTDLIKQKKAATNPILERRLEQALVTLETELADVKSEFKRAKTQSTNAARALKGFNGHEAIAALKKELAL